MEKEDQIEYTKQHIYRILEKIYERKDKKSAYYIAEDVHLGRIVGIKQIQKEPTNKKQLEEVKTLLKTSGYTKYVPKIYDVISQKNEILIIMEHIKGQTLRQCLKTEKEKICQNHKILFFKLCMILQELNYEHRDIKPENIILTKYNNGVYKDIYLIDFGLASLYPFADEGTKGYQAPEQKQEIEEKIKAEKGSKIDIYSAGILLYEMIIGEPPIEGKNYSISQNNQEWTIFLELAKKGISQKEINFIKKCLETNPKNRFATKKDMYFSYKEIREEKN